LLTTILGGTLAGAATVAAPVQDRPGIITPPRVWIENRNVEDAIPVAVFGQPVVTLSTATPIRATLTRQIWEYRTLDVSAPREITSALSDLGLEGWEVTAMQAATGGNTTILLKRPRAN
jgi:hypothetical protein